MDLNSAPGFRLTPLLIIPVLSFIFQFLSAKTSMSTTQMDDSTPGAGMTKNMMYTMPLMSFVMCISLPIVSVFTGQQVHYSSISSRSLLIIIMIMLIWIRLLKRAVRRLQEEKEKRTFSI